MKIRFSICFAASIACGFCGALQAESVERIPLVGGESPNGFYSVVLRVQTAEDGTYDSLKYEIIDNKSGTPVTACQSTYSPGVDMAPKTALSNAKAAEVHWNKESSKIAIDESNFRFLGKVFLLCSVSDRFREVVFPDEELLGAIGLDVERYRVRVEGGWKSDNDLSLSINGRFSQKNGESTPFRKMFNLTISDSMIPKVDMD